MQLQLFGCIFIYIKMNNLFYLFLIIKSIMLNEAIAESTTTESLCKDITSKSKELELKTHLFCDYDDYVRPEGANKNTTKVDVSILPIFIEFDETTSIISLQCWTSMKWTDINLIWKKDDFNGIDYLPVLNDNIWTPDIVVHNAGEAGGDKKSLQKTFCGLSSNGKILCAFEMKYSAHCDSDYTNYPFDVQKCIIELSSWSYTSDEVLLIVSKQIDLDNFIPNLEWDLVHSEISLDIQDFKMNSSFDSHVYKLQFVLVRHGAGMHVVYIAPAIVLMIVTLCVLWFDCDSNERLIIVSIDFICHYICLENLFWNIPFNGETLPGILRFYQSSFLLVSFSLILTIILRELRGRTKPAPQWLSSTTSLILQSKPGQLLLLSILDPKASAFLEVSADDNDDLVNVSEKTNTTWNYVTLLIGWLAFIAIFFAYLILLALYLPSRMQLYPA